MSGGHEAALAAVCGEDVGAGEGEGVVLGVVGRGVDVGCGTAISGAYIWGVVSEMVVVERFSADFGAYC